MTILGIGVDLVHIPRIARILSRRKPDRFASRILSPNEYIKWEFLKQNSNRAVEGIQFLAVRWSVKEAAYKALYPVVRPSWKELTYHGLSKAIKPSLEYHPLQTEDIEKVGRMHVSVSHDGEYVYSSVVVEEPTSHNE